MLIVDSSNQATGKLNRFLIIRRPFLPVRARATDLGASEIFIRRLDISPIDPEL